MPATSKWEKAVGKGGERDCARVIIEFRNLGAGPLRLSEMAVNSKKKGKIKKTGEERRRRRRWNRGEKEERFEAQRGRSGIIRGSLEFGRLTGTTNGGRTELLCRVELQVFLQLNLGWADFRSFLSSDVGNHGLGV